MRSALASFGVLVLLMAGCTAVPSHSGPQVISAIAVNPAVVPSGQPPPPGASPREIVQDFLDASAEEAGAQSSSREYLTRNARGGWQDSPVTVLDSISVGNFTPPATTITVTGRVIGQVNEAGIYTPSRLGTGSGGPINSYVFHIKKVDGQYRIDRLQQQGLLLSLVQFSTIYESHALEFFDLAERYLIPDERYSPLHGAALADWLLGQLAAGPRPELQNAVSTGQGLPSPANGTPPTVRLGEVTEVAVPGAAQLPTIGRDRLAAQIGRTLVDVVNNGLLSITDGGKAIEIPVVGSREFVPAQFDARVGPPQPPPELYYVRDGRVVDADGKQLPGTGVAGSPPLDSVALTNSADPNSLSIAGTVVKSGVDRLYVGTQQLTPRSTEVRAPVTDPQHLPLSRPAWAPGRSEVWIGAGRTLYRVTVSGVAAQQHAVPLGSAANDAPVRAVRVSPDGSRLALVLGLPGLTQLYEGVIVRTAGQVRVDDLTQISPNGVVITDIAWLDPLKLFAIGYLKSNSDTKVCETSVDGSGWTMSGAPGLPPGGPDALTITAGQLAWVEVNDTVWQQSGDSDIWVSPSGTGIDQVPGSNPVYLE